MYNKENALLYLILMMMVQTKELLFDLINLPKELFKAIVYDCIVKNSLFLFIGSIFFFLFQNINNDTEMKI
jgi:hypothetical protein